MDISDYVETVKKESTRSFDTKPPNRSATASDRLVVNFTRAPSGQDVRLIARALRANQFKVQLEPTFHERLEYWGYDPRPHITPDVMGYGIIGVRIVVTSRMRGFKAALLLQSRQMEERAVRLVNGLHIKVKAPSSFEMTAELKVRFRPFEEELAKYLQTLDKIAPFRILKSTSASL